MPIYVVTYDLATKKGDRTADYALLKSELEAQGGCHAADSLFFLDSSRNSKEVVNWLKSLLGENSQKWDKIFAVECNIQTAHGKARQGTKKWVEAHKSSQLSSDKGLPKRSPSIR